MIENNKRIAKNTLLLYFRQLLTMVVSLFTSRIVLSTLGVEDFGIYNVVGGVVVLFSFLNGALTQATQRHLSFELGKKNTDGFNKIFNLSFIVYIGLALVIIIIAETIGLWFLNTMLKIEANKMEAANWVYQFSILTFILNMLRMPFNAAIIAYERMSFYAYISIVEVILKLVIVYLLVIIGADKLKSYALLITFVSAIILLFYYLYTHKHFQACRIKFYWDKIIFNKLLSFSSWSLFGSISVVATHQGINMLLNIFFGVGVNAAMGISNQVCSSVNNFISNFQTAFNPQITKSFAAGEKIYLESLIFQSAKFSFFLLLILSMPILIETEVIFNIWLKEIPPYTISFCRLSILSLLIDSLSGPLWMIIQATGRIKKYQLIISSIFWMNIILSYILFEMGYSPISAFVIKCIVSVVLLSTRLYLFISMLQFPSKKFIRAVIIPVALCSLIAVLPPLLVSMCTTHTWVKFLNIPFSALSTLFSVYCIGLNTSERAYVTNAINKKLLKK